MAVSFLRIGRAGSLKKWLESRGSLTSAPFAALCTKPGDPKKPAKQTSTKITYPVRNWVMQSFPQEAAAQVDPVQKLFIEKIREYSSKSKLTGVLVDAGPEYERNLTEEINRLQRLYGGGDLAKFPDFKFPEPKLEEVSTK